MRFISKVLMGMTLILNSNLSMAASEPGQMNQEATKIVVSPSGSLSLDLTAEAGLVFNHGLSGRVRSGLLIPKNQLFYSFGLSAGLGPEKMPMYDLALYAEIVHRPTHLWAHVISGIDRRENFFTTIGSGFSFFGFETRWSRLAVPNASSADQTQFAWSMIATLRLAIGQALY